MCSKTHAKVPENDPQIENLFAIRSIFDDSMETLQLLQTTSYGLDQHNMNQSVDMVRRSHTAQIVPWNGFAVEPSGQSTGDVLVTKLHELEISLIGTRNATGKQKLAQLDVVLLVSLCVLCLVFFVPLVIAAVASKKEELPAATVSVVRRDG